ncbi:MAG: recombination protein RecR [Verrucomicrobia bacterium]|nr:recombination protein RecR [Verrucomicrobiota bacterium]MBI3869934.1 recombination protein RecR [Verrucomicrobiota bacterium]
MSFLPEALTALQSDLSKLPGIGPRSAERLALHLVQSDAGSVRRLAELMVAAREKVRTCAVCGSLTEASPCGLCTHPNRDGSLVCVVERPVDILWLEKAGNFRGKYHVLGGRISPINGVGPEDLRIEELERRLGVEPIRELVLALATDVEGDATSHYLARRMAAHGVKVTRIAHGLPAGAGLEFADELTLSRALDGRREMS